MLEDCMVYIPYLPPPCLTREPLIPFGPSDVESVITTSLPVACCHDLVLREANQTHAMRQTVCHVAEQFGDLQ